MFASEATRSSVANRVTYSAYNRFATSKPSEQKTAATRAVRHTMRRLGRNLKIAKNIATPSAKEISSRLNRHIQSSAKLRLTLPALRASQVATRAPRTSSVPVPNTMARSSSLATGEQRGDERDDGQQQIERQRAGEERNVFFESRLKRPTSDAGHGPVPAALRLHATGSSSSSRLAPLAPRRRRFASVSRRSIATRAVGSSSSSSLSSSSPSSPAFSAARSRNPRSLRDSLVRDASPGSGAHMEPSTGPKPRTT